MSRETHDSVKLEGVLKNGYGLSPKMVMKDKRLSIEAKAIYAYMSSYAGQSETAFPSVSLMCSDLGISEARLRKHRNLLIEYGYIEIERESPTAGKFGRNIYTIKQLVPEPTIQNTMMVKTNHTKHHDGDLPTWQNVSTNNNSSFNNNSISNNNSVNKDDEEDALRYFQKNIRYNLNPIEVETIGYWEKDYPHELIIEAIKRTAMNGATTVRYTETILKNWQRERLSTVEEVERYEANQQQKGGKRNGSSTGSNATSNGRTEEEMEILAKLKNYNSADYR